MADRIPDALHLAAIVEWSDDAIISKDLDGVIQTWNGAAERIFGFAAAEAIGRPITIIVPPDRLSEEESVIERLRRGEMVSHYETFRRRKDGTLIPISLTVSPIRDPTGRIIGASNISRDITDRRRAQAALAAADARQKDLQARLVALIGASGRLFSSPRLDDVLPAIIGLGRALIPADGYAVWRFDAAVGRWQIGASEGLSEAFVRGAVEEIERGRLTPPALAEPLAAESVRDTAALAARWADYEAEGITSILAVPVSIGGAPTGTLVFYYRTRHRFDDVEIQTAAALGNLAGAAIATAELYDEQRRIREDAERTKQQAAFLAEASTALGSSLEYERTLRTVAELAVPHIADWCAVDMVDEADGAVRRLAVAHVDPARLERARAFRERHPEDPDTGPVARVIRTRTPILASEITDEMLAANARSADHLQAMRDLRICSLIVVPLALHGKTLGALTFVMADSGRRYTDADLRFAQDVAYRAAMAVENARAYRAANAANRAKDEFLATLSHELRTPLNAVLGWTRMLRSGSVAGGKAERAIDVIERNAVAQLRLVEDLLDLSRIITGTFRLDVQRLDVVSAVEAAVESVQPAATAKGVAVHVEAVRKFVLGDAARLQQAVWNLLVNAIKFTPRGGRVAVEVRAAGDQVEIEVSDTGEGIDPAILPFIFDRFRQGDSGTTRAHMGLGLGLAIVRHIAELHGGGVSASSLGKGRGATFRMLLPALDAEQAAQADARQRAADAARSRRPLDGLRVLVVDDDRDARELLTEVLEENGVKVIAAASAAEGLAALERELPDIIVSDIAMSGQDGYDLIRQVRKRPAARGGSVPAVALTAYARAEDGERSLDSGFQVHLAKPVDFEELVSAVAALTGRHSSA